MTILNQTRVSYDKVVSVNSSVLKTVLDSYNSRSLMLINYKYLPLGEVVEFSNSDDVQSFFGIPIGDIAYHPTTLANHYFTAHTNKARAPKSLLMTRYSVEDQKAEILGGVNAPTISTLQGVTSGVLQAQWTDTVRCDINVNLSSVTTTTEVVDTINDAIITELVPHFTLTTGQNFSCQLLVWLSLKDGALTKLEETPLTDILKLSTKSAATISTKDGFSVLSSETLTSKAALTVVGGQIADADVVAITEKNQESFTITAKEVGTEDTDLTTTISITPSGLPYPAGSTNFEKLNLIASQLETDINAEEKFTVSISVVANNDDADAQSYSFHLTDAGVNCTSVELTGSFAEVILLDDAHKASSTTTDLASLQTMTDGTMTIHGITLDHLDFSSAKEFDTILTTANPILKEDVISKHNYMQVGFDTTFNRYFLSTDRFEIFDQVSYPSGNLANILGLNEGVGIIFKSQNKMSMSDVLTMATNYDSNFANIVYAIRYLADFDPIVEVINWNKDNKYLISLNSNDPTLLTKSRSSTCLPSYLETHGYAVQTEEYLQYKDPIVMYYGDIDYVVSQAGTIATFDFTGTGAISLSSREYSGIVPLVTTNSAFDGAVYNGCQFYMRISYTEQSYMGTLNLNGMSNVSSFVGYHWLQYQTQTTLDNLQKVHTLSYNTSSLSLIRLALSNQVFDNGIANNVVATNQKLTESQKSAIYQFLNKNDSGIINSIVGDGYYLQLSFTEEQKAKNQLEIKAVYTVSGEIHTFNFDALIIE